MLPTRRLLYPRRFYVYLDYAVHMPKAYVDRMKRNVPRKVYDNRFGAPPLTRWTIHPDDYKPTKIETFDGQELRTAKRPWENDRLRQAIERQHDYHAKLLYKKFFRKGRKDVPPIPAENWTIFPGDYVEIMVGPDKGVRGQVSHVIREENAVFVEGLHMKLVEKVSSEMAKEHGVHPQLEEVEQPLYVHLRQVMLVDPNDEELCTAKWILNDSKTTYIRVSTRTGFEITIPSAAYCTYEYSHPAKYIEVKEKDTPADVVLKQTYIPKLCTFEQEIEEEMGLEKRQTKKPPTYWY